MGGNEVQDQRGDEVEDGGHADKVSVTDVMLITSLTTEMCEVRGKVPGVEADESASETGEGFCLVVSCLCGGFCDEARRKILCGLKKTCNTLEIRLG